MILTNAGQFKVNMRDRTRIIKYFSFVINLDFAFTFQKQIRLPSRMIQRFLGWITCGKNEDHILRFVNLVLSTIECKLFGSFQSFCFSPHLIFSVNKWGAWLNYAVLCSLLQIAGLVLKWCMVAILIRQETTETYIRLLTGQIENYSTLVST